MTSYHLNGEVRTPEEATHLLEEIGRVFADMASTDEQSAAALAGEGVTGPGVDLANAMHAASSHASSACTARATRYAGHIADRDQYISDDLAGTQRGKYLDPAAQ